MKDYVKAYPMEIKKDKITLVSEVFTSDEEALHFANCFHHNYKGKIKVCETLTVREYIVWMKNVSFKLIHSNFQENLGCYVFANWIFETRK